LDDVKLIEYYVSLKILRFEKFDLYIDIAAQDCPFAFYVHDNFGCQGYRQDLYYFENGIHGCDIGGDACVLPFSNGQVTKMSLHNSFEHFEESADRKFIIEAARVLRPGGLLCVVPFYFGDTYKEDNESGWIDEHGTKHLWGQGARFSRIYDPAQFRDRILLCATGLKGRLHFMEWYGNPLYFLTFERSL
jgi:SAM-dependent methyltransferase